MHFCVFVLIPSEGDAQELVASAMAPFQEDLGDPENVRGYWDWWQLGGRWTGLLSGYEPEADPANTETCSLCYGTGKRNDALGKQARRADPAYTCNGCNGMGKSVKWPTSWGHHSGDVVDAAGLDLTEEQLPYAVLTADGEWLQKECFDRNGFHDVPDFPDRALTAIRAHSGRLVVVDYHS